RRGDARACPENRAGGAGDLAGAGAARARAGPLRPRGATGPQGGIARGAGVGHGRRVPHDGCGSAPDGAGRRLGVGAVLAGERADESRLARVRVERVREDEVALRAAVRLDQVQRRIVPGVGAHVDRLRRHDLRLLAPVTLAGGGAAELVVLDREIAGEAPLLRVPEELGEIALLRSHSGSVDGAAASGTE